MLFLLGSFLIPAKVSAQCTTAGIITVDGNPCDWPSVLNDAANTKKAFKHDPFDVLHIDDQWTGGSQDDDASPHNDWTWIKGNANDKGDIANAGAVLLGCNLYFFGDRTAVNGDAQIGFWFFVTDVHQTGSGDTASGFAGEHSNGDLLIISNFTNGGGNAQPSVYQWQGKTSSSPGGLVLIDATDVNAQIATNTTLYDVPGGTSGTAMYNGQTWTFNPKSGDDGTYPVPLFFEGSLNVCDLPGNDLCFASFLLETRNSQSISASLQDLVAGSFSGVPPAPSVTPGAKCYDGTGITLTANCGTNTCLWFADETGGSPLGAGDGVSGCSITTPSAPGTYIFWAACTNGDCTSGRVADTAVIYPGATIVGDVIPSQADDDADGIRPLTGDLTCPKLYELNLLRANVVDFIASGGVTYTWSLVPDSNPIDNVSFVDHGDGTATFTVNSYIGFSSTYKFIVSGTDENGCVNTDSVCISPTAVLPTCNLCGPALICAGAADQTYSLKSLCTNELPDDISDDLIDFDYVWSITNVLGGGSVTFVGASTNVAEVTTHITGTVTSYTLQLNINGKGPLSINVPPCTITTTVGSVTASDGHDDVSCNGAGDGTVTITFSGGTAPYEIDFNGGGFETQTSPKTYSGLSGGTYTWTVRDVNGCEASGSETVGEPDELQASDGHDDVTCFEAGDGSVTITFSGGTAPYEIDFNGGGYETQTSPKTYSGLSGGSYSWTVRDANGCTKSGSETVGEPDELLASDGHDDVTCNGASDGSVTITFSGGTSPYEIDFNGGGYESQTSPKTYSGLAGGSYSWTVRDANGCTKSGSETVGEPDALSCSLTDPADPACNSTANSVTGTVSGGTSPYTCSAAFDATGTSAGWTVTNCDVTGSDITVTYDAGSSATTVLTVTITDANGCTSTCNVTLSCAGTGKGCTPGFWKNHVSVWDTQLDFVVNNMPNSLTDPVTPGETFVTSTNFWAYFDIPVGTCGISSDPNLTMLGALALRGGDCIALTRHAVSALLGAAAFPTDYPFGAAGATDFASLYTLIRNAFLSCNCEALHNTLAAINELDGDFCGALSKLPQVIDLAFAPGTRLTVTDVYVNAYPNPYSGQVNFNIISPVTGPATLEIYDMVGRKLKVLFSGKLVANMGHSIKYNVPSFQHVPLVYKLTTAGKTVVGKLIPGNRNTIY
jgi:hypothetical protein